MFEKEAEKYASDLELIYKKGVLDGYNKAFVEADKNLKAIVTDFNKANEWHKQDTDNIYDFIAEDWSVKYFICIMKAKRIVAAEGSCDEGYNGEVSVNLFFEHDDEKYDIDDIVWWKEIVLPKQRG